MENPETLPKRCLGCSYILDGLTVERCPECGRPFDPDDPKTFATKIRSGRTNLLQAILGVVSISIPLVTAHLADLGVLSLPRNPIMLLPGPALMIGGWGLEYHVLVVSGRALLGEHEIVQDRTSCWVALSISAIVVVGGMSYMLVNILT